MYNAQEAGELIVRILKNKNITVSKMLRDCGLGKDVVSKMRAGQMPSADKLVAVARYLEVSAEYLLGAPDLNGFSDPNLIDISGLSDESRANLLRQLELLQMADYLEDRDAYIKSNAMPFAARRGSASSIAEIQELYDGAAGDDDEREK